MDNKTLFDKAAPMAKKVGIEEGDAPWICIAKLLVYLGQIEGVYGYEIVRRDRAEFKGRRCSDCGGSMEGESAVHRECVYCRNQI
jgi:hypothetical protein